MTHQSVFRLSALALTFFLICSKSTCGFHSNGESPTSDADGRISEIKQHFSSLRWFGARPGDGPFAESTQWGDIVSRKIGLNATTRLDALFRQRCNRHEHNLERLNNDLTLSTAVDDQSPLANSQEQRIERCFSKFEEAEDKAEEELVAALMNNLTEEEFSKLSIELVTLEGIDGPMFRRVLGISDDQQRQLCQARKNYQRLSTRLLLAPKGSTKSRMENADWWSGRLNVLSLLDREQLFKVQHLIPFWRNEKSFAERLKYIESVLTQKVLDYKPLIHRVELEVLGPLYRAD